MSPPNTPILPGIIFTTKHQTVDIIKLNGSVELGPIRTADVIVDMLRQVRPFAPMSQCTGGGLSSFGQDDRNPLHADEDSQDP